MRRPNSRPAGRGPARSGERREGGFRPRGEGFAPRGPRREGPPREGGFRPRSEGFAPRGPRREGPPREGGFRPRGEGFAPRGPRREGPPREGGFRPRGEGFAPRGPRREGPPREGGFRPRGEGFAPRGPRREGPPREGGFRPRGEGFAPRGPRREGPPREGGFRPRSEGFAPRGPRREGPPREGSFRPRGEGFAPRGPRRDGPPREGGFRPRSEGFAPRGPRRDGPPREGGFRPRSEGFAPRGPRREGPPREGGFRPRGEGFAPRGPRREGPPREGGFRPRSEGFAPRGPRREGPPREGGFRPRGEGFAPRGDDRPRFPRPSSDRAPFSRGPREERSGAPDDIDSRDAVNRSRPVYPRGHQVRWRRDGKPSARPASWGRPDADRAIDAPRGGRDDRRAWPPVSNDGPSLPADPREAALRILHAVDSRSAFSDRLLDGAHARPGADPRDRALLHELVKGALRWRGRLDAALDARVHVGLANTQPWIRNILRLGAYQLLFLDRVPAHAAVDESVKLAHKYAHPGAAGLVNSVLRRLADERETMKWPEGDDVASLSAWGSHPEWIVERWLERFGPAETRVLLEADNRAVPTGLRANALRNTRDELIEALAAEGVEATPGKLSPDLVWVEGHHSPGALEAFADGRCTAQDESESLVARVVAPRPNERVLDLCAAPGGKTTHLAELMGDEGEVWALERDANRIATLNATVERLGAQSVHVVEGDGRVYPFPMPFDRVLVDAPCSGMGVLARRADARWRKGPEVLAEMPPLQLDLLRAAARHVVAGGLLVYSVCSFEPEETDHVVARFLTEHPDWVVDSVAGSVPDAVVTPEGYMRVLPHVHGCDGAFAVRFRRK